MLELAPVSFLLIQKWFVDFQKKSHCYEMPSEGSEIIGIFEDKALIGYFIICGYADGDMEIQQGYLTKEARHKNKDKQAMALLEAKAKEIGYKKIILGSNRTLKAYTHFMASMGYKPERIIYSKVI